MNNDRPLYTLKTPGNYQQLYITVAGIKINLLAGIKLYAVNIHILCAYQ